MLDTPPPKMEEQDCRGPSSMTSSRPIPPTSKNAFLCLETNSPASFGRWSALFFSLRCAAALSLAALFPSLGRAARYAAAYCFCSFFFCHMREMGLLAASCGFSTQSLLVQASALAWTAACSACDTSRQGFQLAVCLPILELAVSVADSLFHAALRQVPRLHADIFLLHLMHLRMGGVDRSPVTAAPADS